MSDPRRTQAATREAVDVEEAAARPDPDEPAAEPARRTAATARLDREGASRAPSIEREDVDDLIEIAARAQDADAERISVEELQEVAGELGIKASYVEDAVGALEKERKGQTRQAAEAAALRKKRLVGAALALAALLGLALSSGLYSQSVLSDSSKMVEKKHAQLPNVLERQAETRARYESFMAAAALEQDAAARARNAEALADFNAELAGAENRVRIERKRYDEAAVDYNAAASRFPHSLWRGPLGFPAEVPLSADLLAPAAP